MVFILDVIFVIIFAITVIIIAKRGFFASVLRAVSIILSIVISISVAPILSEFIYNNILAEKINASVLEWTEVKIDVATAITVDKVDSLVSEMPAFIRGYYNSSVLSEDIVAQAIKDNAVDPKVFADSLCDNLLHPAIITLLNYIIAFILFAIVIILCKFVLRFFDRYFKGNFIGRINTFLGAILGILYATGVTVVLCFTFRFINTFFYIEKLEALLNSSYVYEFISGLI